MSNTLDQQLRALVGEVHPEDGVDPELLRKRDPSGKRVKQRKLAALCRQVQLALHLSLPADLELEVVSVSPDTDPGRLIVILAPNDTAQDRAILTARVHALAGKLRDEVAQAIHRRRTPELVFRISARPALP